MNDVGAVRVRDRRERLLDELQRRLRREAPPHAARERALAERHRNHEPVRDERRVANRQDVRMLEPMGEPRLALEVDEEVLAHRALVRNLQRDVQSVDRVDGLIDGRDRAFGDPPLDAILAEFLPCFQRHESGRA